MGNLLNKQCPQTTCPPRNQCSQNQCPSMKENNLNTVDGWFRGSTNSHMNIPAYNASQCREIATWNKHKGVISYTYRKNTHPQNNAKNTCILRTVQGADLEENMHHISGCVDNTKNPMNGCK